MFQFIGNFATQHRRWIVVGWIVAAVALIALAPPLDEVSSTDQKDFLPADTPFARAQEVYEETFPELFGPSSTMLLIDAGEGGNVHNPEVWAYIEEAETWLNSDAAPDNIDNVAAPTTDPDFADALISPDGRIALISVSLTTVTDAVVTTEAVNAIEEWLESNEPEGFDVYQTGEAGLNAQAEESTFTTMDRTIVITFGLVIIALLVIYRSPISPLIPLFSVTMAFIATIGFVSILAHLEIITVITQVNALLVVVMYGAGTDYCLFLISRFREEMAEDVGVEKATRRTVRMVGETITSSAGTIFVGFMAMTFAEIGMLRNAGPMLAIGIAVSLLSGLTLVPALLAMLGNRAFWPGKASHRSAGRFYGLTSQLVSSRPLTTIMIIVVVMLPFSIYGLARELNYDFVAELPSNIPSVKAYNLLGEHMGGGNLFPLTVVVTERNPETMPAEIARLTDELYAIDGVVDVRGLNTPLGITGDRFNDLLRVDGQLSVLLALAGEDDDESAVDPEQAITVIGGMQRYMDTLAERFPEVAEDENLLAAREIVGGGLLTIGLRQNEMMGAVEGLVERFETIDDAYLMPPTGEGDMFALLSPLVENYIGDGGTAYRLEVVLDDPLGTEARDNVKTMRDLLRSCIETTSHFHHVLHGDAARGLII